MTADTADQSLSYSHRVCRRCGADLRIVHRRWLGDGWRCLNDHRAGGARH